jgi:hypothetical protein
MPQRPFNGHNKRDLSMYPKRFATSIGAVAALLFSMTTHANPLSVKAVDAKTAIAAPAGESTRAAILTTSSSAFIAGDHIGEVHAGDDCGDAVEREWSELIGQRIALDLPRVFSEQLARANYATGAGHKKDNPLEVSAFVNDLALKICRGNQGTWHGGMYVQVSWQVLSPESGRVVYQASTEGSYVVSQPRRVSAASGLREALAVAVRNLLADKRFAAMLRQPAASERVAASIHWEDN